MHARLKNVEAYVDRCVFLKCTHEHDILLYSIPALCDDSFSLDTVDAFVSSSSFLEWTRQDDKVLGVLCVLCNDSFSLVAVYDCGQEKQELPNRSRTPSFQHDCLIYMTINSCAIVVDRQFLIGCCRGFRFKF